MSTSTKVEVTNENILKSEVSQMEVLGECVFTDLPSNRGKKNTHLEIVTSLTTNGLDKDVARQLLPRQAFARACEKLSKNRVIDKLREDKDDILFQFSKQYAEDDSTEGGKQVGYRKEVKILLEKTTGKLACKDDRVREDAQKLLDQCMEERTTSDVSAIVVKLLKSNTDIVPLANGAWFVRPDETPFVDKVQSFLQNLGRNLSRLSIPKGNKNNDHTIAQSVVKYVEGLLEGLRDRTEQLSLNTRAATSSTIAKERNEIRSKIGAFSSILGDYSTQLMEEAEEDDNQLRETLEKLAEDRKTAPVVAKGSSNLFGHSLTKVMHYLGKNGWGFDKAKKAVSLLTDVSGVKESSLRTFWSDGRNPTYSKPADLTAAQVAELEAAALLPDPVKVEESREEVEVESVSTDNAVATEVEQAVEVN
jgi:hypothetical protein